MTPVTRHLCRAALLAVLCVLGGAASFALGPAAAATNLSLATSARNACSPGTLTAPAGSTTLSFTNATDDWQSFGVLGVGVGSPDRVREGGTSTLTATLAAGTYTYWCGDDQSKAMRGTLTVTAPPTTSPPGTTGPSPPPPPPPPPAGLSITTSDNAFSTTTLAADTGNITITVTNAGRDAHTFTIGGLVNVVVSPGQTKTQTFFANAGTYTFVCAYHGEMRGTLTVRQGAAPPPPPQPPPPPPPPAPPGGGPASVTITDFAFNPSSVSAPAGAVTLTIANAGVVPHTFTIDGLVNASVAPGQTTTVSFTATDGTYRIYCAVSGHVSLGMTGTLVVGTGGSGSPPRPPAPPKPPAPPAPAPPGAAGLTITDFAFSPGSLTVPAGNVTLAITNAGQLPHTFTIDGLANVDLAPGQSATVGFSAPAGSYRFYCAVAGHVSLGMTGTLIVAADGAPAPPAASPPPAAPAPPADPSAGDGHAGHQSSGTTETPQQLAPGCRPRATIVLRGTVVSASPRELALTVRRTNRAGRAYAKKRAALLLHTKTVFGRVGAPVLHGLSPGDSITVSAGRCRAYGRRLVAMRVDVSASAPVDTSGGTTLRLTADAKGFPRFDKKSLESPAGRVTLTLANPSPLPHNISIEGVVTGKQVVNGGTSTVTAVLKPGSYTYLCTLPGHAQAGMKGTLVVR
jgi:plastocyanin